MVVEGLKKADMKGTTNPGIRCYFPLFSHGETLEKWTGHNLDPVGIFEQCSVSTLVLSFIGWGVLLPIVV